MSGVVDRNIPKKVVVKKKEHFFDRKLLWFTSLFIVFTALVYTYPPGAKSSTRGTSPAGTSNGGISGQEVVSAGKGTAFYLDMGHELLTKGVYGQALHYYSLYLESAGPGSENAALAFKAGDIAKDRLKKYDEAITFYLLVKRFDDTSPLLSNADLRIIACLEALGKTRESQSQLDQMVNVDRKKKQSNPFSPIVAETGTRTFSLADVDDGIASLPEKMRSQYEGPDGRMKYFQQHLLMPHLLYELGRKEGLNESAQVKTKLAEIERNLVVQEVLSRKISKMEMPTEEELKMFFEANKEQYAADFEGNRNTILSDYVTFSHGQKIGRLMEEQMKIQNVRLYAGALQNYDDDSSQDASESNDEVHSQTSLNGISDVQSQKPLPDTTEVNE